MHSHTKSSTRFTIVCIGSAFGRVREFFHQVPYQGVGVGKSRPYRFFRKSLLLLNHRGSRLVLLPFLLTYQTLLFPLTHLRLRSWEVVNNLDVALLGQGKLKEVRTVSVVLTLRYCCLDGWLVFVQSDSTPYRASKSSRKRYTRAHLKIVTTEPSCLTSVTRPAARLPFPPCWLFYSPGPVH